GDGYGGDTRLLSRGRGLSGSGGGWMLSRVGVVPAVERQRSGVGGVWGKVA
nr:hypothetical protein [Tanacetum cinerariifolium]